MEEKFTSSSPNSEAGLLPDSKLAGQLPRGAFDLSLSELRKLACFSAHRGKMWQGLVSFLAWAILKRSFKYAYVGGGFVSGSSSPRDIDLILETECAYGPEFFAAVAPFFAVGLEKLERVFGVHLHFCSENAPAGFMDYRAFFQYEKPNAQREFDTSLGLVRIDLTGEEVLTEIHDQIYERAPDLDHKVPPVLPDVDPGDRVTHRLISTVQLLSRANCLDSIVEIVRTSARSLMNSDGASFVLRDGDKCHYVDEDAISPLWKGQKFAMSSCISGWVMTNRKTAFVPDIHQDDRIPLAAYAPTFVKSIAMAPIRSEDPVGAIGIYWALPHAENAFEMDVLEALANSTSIAIQNVQLRSQLEGKALDRKREFEMANRELEVFSHSVAADLRRVLAPIRSQNNVKCKLNGKRQI